MALTVDKLGWPVKVTGTTALAETVFSSQDTLFGNPLISHVEWHKPTTIGHRLVIKEEGTGRELLVFTCEKADESQIKPLLKSVKGIVIDDMDSGEVYIYRSPR